MLCPKWELHTHRELAKMLINIIFNGYNDFLAFSCFNFVGIMMNILVTAKDVQNAVGILKMLLKTNAKGKWGLLRT